MILNTNKNLNKYKNIKILIIMFKSIQFFFMPILVYKIIWKNILIKILRNIKKQKKKIIIKIII